MAAGVASGRLSQLAGDGRAQLGPRHLPAGGPERHLLLLRAQEHGGPAAEPGRGGPGTAGHLQEAGYPAARAGNARRGGRGRGVRLGLRGHHLQGQAGGGGRDLLLDLRGGARAPGTGQEVPGLRGAQGRQLLRRPQLGGIHRRLLCLHPQGRTLPHGAVHLLPHQRGQHRPVRAHPDRRRRGQLRELPGRLHRAAAR